MRKTYTSKGIIKQFPQKGGWVYVPVTQTYKDFGGKPKWGLVPATITIGNTTWKKSLLPFGDGTLFIALSEKIRKVENLKVGDSVTITFTV